MSSSLSIGMKLFGVGDGLGIVVFQLTCHVKMEDVRIAARVTPLEAETARNQTSTRFIQEAWG